MGSENASMPMKCIDQMPVPIATGPADQPQPAAAGFALALCFRDARRELEGRIGDHHRHDDGEGDEPVVVGRFHGGSGVEAAALSGRINGVPRPRRGDASTKAACDLDGDRSVLRSRALARESGRRDPQSPCAADRELATWVFEDERTAPVESPHPGDRRQSASIHRDFRQNPAG